MVISKKPFTISEREFNISNKTWEVLLTVQSAGTITLIHKCTSACLQTEYRVTHKEWNFGDDCAEFQNFRISGQNIKFNFLVQVSSFLGYPVLYCWYRCITFQVYNNSTWLYVHPDKVQKLCFKKCPWDTVFKLN